MQSRYDTEKEQKQGVCDRAVQLKKLQTESRDCSGSQHDPVSSETASSPAWLHHAANHQHQPTG